MSSGALNSTQNLNSGSTFKVNGGTNTIAGVTTIDGTSILRLSTSAPFSTATLDINGGKLTGTGLLVGAVNNNGVVAPGTSPGSLAIFGNYIQGPGGVLIAELAGTGSPGVNYDFLSVSGVASLDGELKVQYLGSFTPLIGDAFDIISADNITGDFAILTQPIPGQLSAIANFPAAGNYQLETVTAAPPSTPPLPDADNQNQADDQIRTMEESLSQFQAMLKDLQEQDEEDEGQPLLMCP